ncbi:MAG: nucleotidyltransferase family protein [Alteraurantiacibacter sp.]
MSADRALLAQRHALLAMVSATVAPDAAALARFGPEDWQAIATMAGQHRLGALLHDLIRQRGATWPVPADVRERWKAQHLRGAMRAMSLQLALRRMAGVLVAHDLPFAVLKGGWLAWHAYPSPAHRPMRDIDLLVRTEDAIAAFAALEAAGFTRRADDVTPLDHALVHAKHLPPLFAPDKRVAVELHTRIIHDVPAGDLTGSIGDSAALLARTVPRDLGGFVVPTLSPTDTLLHLIVHAAYDHRFDNGPLVLNDIAAIVRTCPVDWDQFAAMAKAGGWQRGSQLLLQMTQRYHGPLAIPDTLGLAAPLDDAVLDSAALLMLVDTRSAADTHFRAGLSSQAHTGKLLQFLRERAFPKRHVLARFAGLPLESRRVWLHYPAWLLTRSRQRLLSVGGPGQQADQRHLLAVEGWLQA